MWTTCFSKTMMCSTPGASICPFVLLTRSLPHPVEALCSVKTVLQTRTCTNTHTWACLSEQHIIIKKVFYKAQNLVCRDYSKHIHAHTHLHTYTSMLTIPNLIYTQLKKWAESRGLRQMTTAVPNEKIWQVYSFGKRNVLSFDLKESREGFWWKGRARSFHAEGLKTEKAREPKVESLVRRIWRLRVSEEEQRVREGV